MNPKCNIYVNSDDTDVWDVAKRRAEAAGISLSSLVTNLLEKWIDGDKQSDAIVKAVVKQLKPEGISEEEVRALARGFDRYDGLRRYTVAEAADAIRVVARARKVASKRV